MSFYEILCRRLGGASMPVLEVKILNVQSYKAICQLFPEVLTFYHVYNEPESPKLFQN